MNRVVMPPYRMGLTRWIMLAMHGMEMAWEHPDPLVEVCPLPCPPVREAYLGLPCPARLVRR